MTLENSFFVKWEKKKSQPLSFFFYSLQATRQVICDLVCLHWYLHIFEISKNINSDMRLYFSETIFFLVFSGSPLHEFTL